MEDKQKVTILIQNWKKST